MADMIVDCFTYNGEADTLEIRLNVLKDVVDQFVIVEFDQTFSGKLKPYHYAKAIHEGKVAKEFWNKIKFAPMTELDWNTSEYKALAGTSPNVPKDGPEHWRREFMMKESIKKALVRLEDDDIVFIGDVDEIWDPQVLEHLSIKTAIPGIFRFDLKVYTYFLNNRSSEKFTGGLLTTYERVKSECLNHLRTANWPTIQSGWHFTSMGGPEALKRKLTDSYTEESYAPPQVLDSLEANMNAGRDFLGRDFKMWCDESDWPTYLKNNREKYKHLLRSRNN